MNEEEFKNENKYEEENQHDDEDNKNKPKDIFTENSYSLGDGLTDDYEFTNEIKVDESYSIEYLKNIYEYNSYIDNDLIRDQILELINSNQEMYDKVYNRSKQKFNKQEANEIFSAIFKKIKNNKELNNFLDPITILDVVSEITEVNHKKLFDYLEYKYREIIIVELNKRYEFLGGEDRLF